MDLRAYSFSSMSSVPSRSESSSSESGDEIFEPSPPKRLCTITTSQPKQPSKSRSVSDVIEDTIKNGNNNFLGLNMMNILKVHFAESVRNTETPLSELGVHGSRNLSQIGGRQLRR